MVINQTSADYIVVSIYIFQISIYNISKIILLIHTFNEYIHNFIDHYVTMSNDMHQQISHPGDKHKQISTGSDNDITVKPLI